MKRVLQVAITSICLLLLLPVLQGGVARASGSNGTWSLTGNMNVARAEDTATLLPNGKVLVAGGEDGNGTPFTSAGLYDPVSGSWSPTGSMNVPHAFHTATLLGNGKVLVAGGYTGFGGTAAAELYDPASGSWSLTGSMTIVRGEHSATLLANGQVLVIGGDSNGNYTNTAELYDPGSGTFASTGSMNIIQVNHTTTLLQSGQVLVAGGIDLFGSPLASAELYDPGSGTFASTGSMNVARRYHTATLLPNGKVLVAGGADSNGTPFTSAELYDPASGSWSLTGSMNVARFVHSANLLQGGKVLVAGGQISSGITNTAELYDPGSGAWALTGSMNVALSGHTATLLQSGQVLAAGGFASGSVTTTAELYFLDTTPPVLSLPSNITVNGNSSGQAVVNYTVTATDPDNPPSQLTINCSPASGSTFTIGTTTVNCSASDPAGNTTTGSFTVTVKDVTPPVLSLPSNITVNATGAQGAVVTFTATATDDDGTSPPVTCMPASGSTFSFGKTTVTCSATDQAGNTSSGSFAVTVRPVLTLSVPTNVKPTEGIVLNRVVATGKAYGTANPLTATINWGDGNSSTITVTPATDGSYSVTGSHTYAEEGSYPLTITVSDSSGKRSVMRSGSATVSDAALKVTRLTATKTGTTVTQKGIFRDADPNGTLTDYAASINWGDGATSSATIGTNTGGPGFTTIGSHSYAQHGTYTETLTITDAGGSSIVGTLTITV